MSKLHRWGVEIEAFGLEHREVKEIVEEETDDVCLIHERLRSSPLYWVVTNDGSIIGERPFELRSPAMTGEEEPWVKIRAVCRGLQKAGARVNKTCGLHVHHDAQYVRKALEVSGINSGTLETVAIGLYARLESVIDEVMPLSRRYNMNPNCISLRSFQEECANKLTASLQSNHLQRDMTDLILQGSLFGHYPKISVSALRVHGTLEYRQHSGTLMASKIIPWVKLTGLIHEKIADAALARSLPNEFTTLEEALDYIGADKELAAYWLARRAHFQRLDVKWPADECTCRIHKVLYYGLVREINNRIRAICGFGLSEEAVAALPPSRPQVSALLASLEQVRPPFQTTPIQAVRSFLKEVLQVRVPLTRRVNMPSEEQAEDAFVAEDGVYVEEREAQYMQLTKAGAMQRLRQVGAREEMNQEYRLPHTIVPPSIAGVSAAYDASILSSAAATDYTMITH